MLIFATSVSIVCVLFILSPFVLAKGGQLRVAASINSPDQLEAIKKSILARYIEEERAFNEKRILKMAWEQRKAYLTNRYIDAARRLDYLKDLVSEQKKRGL